MKPSNVLTGTVVGRFLFGLGDGPDVNDEPDFVAARGRVTFIAGESTHPDLNAVPAPVIMLLDPVVGVFDAEGYLCTPKADGTAGTRGVKLVANENPELLVQDWTWNVTYKFESSTGVSHTIKPHGIYVYADADTDLVTAIKLPTSPGIPLEQVEAAVLRAEAEARAAAQSVQDMTALATTTLGRTFTEATVVGDELVLSRENGASVVVGDVRGLPGPAGPNTVPTDQAVAGNVDTEGTLTRAAVLAVVDGREVDTPQLADQAVEGSKIAPDAVSLAKLTPGVRDQLDQYEAQIEERPTTAVVVAETIARDQVKFSVTSGYNASPRYKYHVVRVKTGGFRPGIVGKHFADDYEKTWVPGTTFVPPRKPVAEFAARLQAPFVVNADAWGTDTAPVPGEITGLQIKDGVLYHDFSDWYKGRESLGILPTGQFRLYNAQLGDTAQTALDDGVTDTFSFGPALVKDGAAVDLTSVLSEWADMSLMRPRTILGQTSTGDVLVILVEGDNADSPGLGGQAMAALAFDQGCAQAVLLDSGGSTQAQINGAPLAMSSDVTERPVPSVLAIYAPQADLMSRRMLFTPLPLQGAVTTSNGGKYAVKLEAGGKRLLIRGSFANVLAANTVIGKLPKGAYPDEWVYKQVPVVNGAALDSAQIVIKSNGDVQITRKNSGAYVAADRYDIYVEVDL